MTSFKPTLISIQRLWLFLFVVAIPFSTHYITNTSFAFSYINLFSLVFIALGIIGLLTKAIPYTPIKDKPTLAVIGLFFLALAYALLFTHPLRNGIGLWVSRMIQPSLVGFFVYQMLAAQALKIEELATVLFASLVPQLVGGFLQAVHIIPYQDSGRVSVAYRWPNTFARYIEVILTLTLPWLIFKFNRALPNLKWVGYAVWIAGLFLVISSKSYDGTVSLILATAIMIFLLPAGFAKLKAWTLIILASLTALVVPNLSHLPKWQTSITASRLTRLEFWQVAAALIKQHFWTGIGIKSWETHYGEYVLKYGPNHPPLNWVSSQPQNFFLDSFLKAGFPGFLAITLVLVWPIWRGWQISRQSNLQGNGWFGFSLVAYGLAMLFFGSIDDPLWSDDTMPLLFILLLAAAYVYTEMIRKRTVIE